jgi:Tfp pilus assembly protein PilV
MIVVVLLAVAMAMVIGWARVAVVQIRQAHAAEDQLQADWLAESALARAGAKLAANPDYQGETWQASATELDRSTATAGGVTLITVEPIADRPTARRVSVRADFPAAGAEVGPNVHRVSKQAIFNLPPSADSTAPPAEERP